jgi:hypothetical protein
LWLRHSACCRQYSRKQGSAQRWSSAERSLLLSVCGRACQWVVSSYCQCPLQAVAASEV